MDFQGVVAVKQPGMISSVDFSAKNLVFVVELHVGVTSVDFRGHFEVERMIQSPLILIDRRKT